MKKTNLLILIMLSITCIPIAYADIVHSPKEISKVNSWISKVKGKKAKKYKNLLVNFLIKMKSSHPDEFLSEKEKKGSLLNKVTLSLKQAQVRLPKKLEETKNKSGGGGGKESGISKEGPAETTKQKELAKFLAGKDPGQVLDIMKSLKAELLSSVGKKSSPSQTKAALLVIDMQEDFITRDGNQNKKVNQTVVSNLIQAQEDLIKTAVRKNIPIFVIEYEGYGETNPRLTDLAQQGDVTTIIKTSDSALFGEPYENPLTKKLIKKGITDLVILGANKFSCVSSTIDSGLALNFNITACTHAIADFNETPFAHHGQYHVTVNGDCKEDLFSQTNCTHAVEDFFTSGKLTKSCLRCSKSEKEQLNSYQAIIKQEEGKKKRIATRLTKLATIFGFIAIGAYRALVQK